MAFEGLKRWRREKHGRRSLDPVSSQPRSPKRRPGVEQADTSLDPTPGSSVIRWEAETGRPSTTTDPHASADVVGVVPSFMR